MQKAVCLISFSCSEIQGPESDTQNASFPVVEDVFRSFTQVKVPTSLYRNTTSINNEVCSKH